MNLEYNENMKTVNGRITANKIFIGALAVVVAALLWSLDGIFLRPQLSSISPTLVVFLEHSLGFIILIPFLFIYKSKLKKITASTERYLRFPKKFKSVEKLSEQIKKDLAQSFNE